MVEDSSWITMVISDKPQVLSVPKQPGWLSSTTMVNDGELRVVKIRNFRMAMLNESQRKPIAQQLLVICV